LLAKVRATIPLDAADVKTISSRSRGFSTSSHPNAVVTTIAATADTSKAAKEGIESESKGDDAIRGTHPELSPTPTSSISVTETSKPSASSLSTSQALAEKEEEDDDEFTDFTGPTANSSSISHAESTQAIKIAGTH
jgi:hypothetical protein